MHTPVEMFGVLRFLFVFERIMLYNQKYNQNHSFFEQFYYLK